MEAHKRCLGVNHRMGRRDIMTSSAPSFFDGLEYRF
jgi:hypothetical protein